jgi:hypothetical protein
MDRGAYGMEHPGGRYRGSPQGGADFLDGGDGDDTLVGGLDDDLLVDASGNDTASYADHARPVIASVGGTGGAIGETDTIGAGIENLTGGGGGDTLNGDDTETFLDGGAGDDHLSGFGADLLKGDIGLDFLDTGNDTLVDRVNGLDQVADRITCAPPDQLAVDAFDVRLGC